MTKGGRRRVAVTSLQSAEIRERRCRGDRDATLRGEVSGAGGGRRGGGARKGPGCRGELGTPAAAQSRAGRARSPEPPPPAPPCPRAGHGLPRAHGRRPATRGQNADPQRRSSGRGPRAAVRGAVAVRAGGRGAGRRRRGRGGRAAGSRRGALLPGRAGPAGGRRAAPGVRVGSGRASSACHGADVRPCAGSACRSP